MSSDFNYDHLGRRNRTDTKLWVDISVSVVYIRAVLRTSGNNTAALNISCLLMSLDHLLEVSVIQLHADKIYEATKILSKGSKNINF